MVEHAEQLASDAFGPGDCVRLSPDFLRGAPAHVVRRFSTAVGVVQRVHEHDPELGPDVFVLWPALECHTLEEADNLASAATAMAGLRLRPTQVLISEIIGGIGPYQTVFGNVMHVSTTRVGKRVAWCVHTDGPECISDTHDGAVRELWDLCFEQTQAWRRAEGEG